MSLIYYESGNCKQFPVSSDGRVAVCKQDPVKPETKAPVAEVSLCEDPVFRVIPDAENPYAIASLFNECCDPFWDENGDIITLLIDGINPMARKGSC